jgi:hypothetical protein
MQITQTTDTGFIKGQFPSLRFRFDEHLDDISGFTRSSSLTIGPIEFGRRSYGDPETTRIHSARRTPAIMVPAILEAVRPDGEILSLPRMNFTVYETDVGELVYSNKARSEAWEISISSDSQKKHLTMYCHFSYAGLNVKDSLNNIRFLEALASGGELRILKADDRMVLGRARVAEGGFVPTDSRWSKILEWLVYIQERVGVPINLPDHDIVITHDDAATVFSVVRILETGRATATAEPWVTVSTPEQARAALETFGNGKPAPMVLTFANHIVQLFGADIPLGPTAFLCRETYITEEDLTDVRAAIEEADHDSQINIRLTPYEGCSMEATYQNWLPQDASTTLESSVYEEKYGSDVVAPDLPTHDADAAVALLQSWYDEDADEQRDTWEKLKVALDEERLSDRKLFP